MREQSFIVATYSDADSLVRAVDTVRAENFNVYDVYAPYPIHGLDRAMGLKRSRLPWVTFAVAMCGLAGALVLQFYTAVLDWPLNVGGKPNNSTLAFLPVTFELTVLTSGLATVAALFLRGRLYPGKKERLIVEGVTNNKFALVLRKKDASFDTRRARQLLEESGADRVQEKEAEL
ncbi:MAG TPA: DUF3341 domain-containing protein [Candidatus Angelobacter sp.]|jgi:hypothetical protein|nr:DUF3341 domain-containing protein [Candidatus Angelobacter sp.]